MRRIRHILSIFSVVSLIIPRALSFYRTDSASQERKNGSLGGVGGGGGYKIDERRDSPPLFVSSLSASKSEPPASKPG